MRFSVVALLISSSQGSPVLAQHFKALLTSISRESNISIVLPGQPAFANVTKPFNLRFDFQPAAVAFPTSVQEVSELVRLADHTNHQAVARSGGHSYIANGLGGKNGVLVIDLSNFKQIMVDNESNTAVIQTGSRLGDIVTALNAHKRAIPHGTCPYVGIGGHSAHGGFGFTSRMWGLTLDVITSIELILANGTITTASQNQNSDLFWAMRGAGSSFGIATSITVRTFPAPPTASIFSYNWQLSAQEAASAFATYQSFVLDTADLPPEFDSEMVMKPGNMQGNINLTFAGGFYASRRRLEAILAPFLKTLPSPQTQSLDTGNYLHSAINLAGGSLDTAEQPDETNTFYAKSLMTPQKSPMGSKAMRAMMDVLANEGFTTSLVWFVQADLVGGANSAINTVKPTNTAFAHRDSLFTIQLYASSPDGNPPYPNSGFRLLDNIVSAVIDNSPPNWDYGAYTNYVDDRLADWQKRYYGQNYPRLRQLKDIYDHRGTFTFPTSIQD